MTAAALQVAPPLLAGPPVLVAGAVVLGVGTYAIRLSGTLLHSRMQLGARLQTLVTRGVVVLLAALAVTATVVNGGAELAGPSRLAGVAVGGMLAWRKAPLVVVVPAAALTAAGLRVLGVS